MNDPRFPIGKFSFLPPSAPKSETSSSTTSRKPRPPCAPRCRASSPQQIETPYRDGGWTVRQVVHHVPDSHMNAYIRFKLALTEDAPTIKPYMEDRWAKSDRRRNPRRSEVSLALLDSLHDRWVRLLRSLDRKTGSAPSIIPSSESCRWKKTWRFMPGTAGITSRTSRS